MAKRKSDVKRLYKRQFLNNSRGTAAVEIDLNHYTNHEDKCCEFDGGIKISDCFRAMTLEFNAWKKKDYKPLLSKIRRLIEALEEAERFMIENNMDYEDNAPKDSDDEQATKAKPKRAARG